MRWYSVRLRRKPHQRRYSFRRCNGDGQPPHPGSPDSVFREWVPIPKGITYRPWIGKLGKRFLKKNSAKGPRPEFLKRYSRRDS